MDLINHPFMNPVGIMTSTSPTDSKQQAYLQSLMRECPRIFDEKCHQMSLPPSHFTLVENSKPVAGGKISNLGFHGQSSSIISNRDVDGQAAGQSF
jgi:hypothetical protein